jgi:hypothetical protein
MILCIFAATDTFYEGLFLSEEEGVALFSGIVRTKPIITNDNNNNNNNSNSFAATTTATRNPTSSLSSSSSSPPPLRPPKDDHNSSSSRRNDNDNDNDPVFRAKPRIFHLGGLLEDEQYGDPSVVVTTAVVTKPMVINDGNMSALLLEDDSTVVCAYDEGASPIYQRSVDQRYEMVPKEYAEYQIEVKYDTDLTRCEYVEDWEAQTTVPPTCNSIHEIGTFRLFMAKSPSYYYDDMTFSPSRTGSMKQVWEMNKDEADMPVIFKTNMLDGQHYTVRQMYGDVKDAIVMERTSASQHIMDMYGWCQQSAILQRADGALNDWVRKQYNDKHIPLHTQLLPTIVPSGHLLHYAHMMTKSVYDMQMISDVNPNLPMVIHNDIKRAQFLYNERDDGSGMVDFRLNDFNFALFATTNKTATPPTGLTDDDTCPHIVKDASQEIWARGRSPEEFVNGNSVTSAIDIAALGSIYYALLTGHDPFIFEYIADDSNVTLTNEDDWIWEKRVEITDDDFAKTLNDRISVPSIPISLLKSSDRNIQFMIQLMKDCREYNPKARPTTAQLLERFKKFFADSPKNLRRRRRRTM